MKVAFLGLGIMGSRMAANLVKKGHEVKVWNRTASRAAPLEKAGARIARTPSDAVEGTEAVCLCLANPDAVTQTFLDGSLRSLSKHALVIDFSTGTPLFAQKIAASVGAFGARFIEAPMTGSKN